MYVNVIYPLNQQEMDKDQGEKSNSKLCCRFRVIFVQVVPCISLVILNILLFSAMRRAEQRRRRLTINRTNNNEKRNASNKSKRGTIGRRLSIFGFNTKEARDRRQRDANSTTLMLIVVIAVFLAVELPLSTMTALHTISSK